MPVSEAYVGLREKDASFCRSARVLEGWMRVHMHQIHVVYILCWFAASLHSVQAAISGRISSVYY